MGATPQPAPQPGAERRPETRCARCGRPFHCGADSPSCWCDAVELTPAKRERLAALGLQGCLCRECLEGL